MYYIAPDVFPCNYRYTSAGYATYKEEANKRYFDSHFSILSTQTNGTSLFA